MSGRLVAVASRSTPGPARWLKNRARAWERRDLPFSVAWRAAAAEIEPTRWAPRWHEQLPAYQDRILDALRLRAVALACDGRGALADAYGEAADKLDERRGR